MSPSGPPVTTYCMRAEAPGRSGWLAASSLDSSSHSCVSHFAMCVSPWSTVWTVVTAARRLSAHEIAHTGEQVVLGLGRRHQAAGQHVVVVGMHGAGDVRRKAEPERRIRVD